MVVADAEAGGAVGDAGDDEVLLQTDAVWEEAAGDVRLVGGLCEPGLGNHHTSHESCTLLAWMNPHVVGQEFLCPSTVPLLLGVVENPPCSR